MATIDVEFKLNPEIAGPLDARNQGTSSDRPTGLYLYNGLLRYETDGTGKLVVYNGSSWVDAGTKVGNLTGGTLSQYVPKSGDTTISGTLTSTDYKITGGSSKTFASYDTDECPAKYAVNAEIAAQVSNLVGTAPATLNTLQELALEMTNPATSGSAVTVLDNIAGQGTNISNIINQPGATLETDQILATFKDGAYNTAGTEQTHATDDYVQNAMGRIPSGMTIAQMRTKFTKLDHLISAMLNVAEVPATSPAISGTSFSLSGQGATTVTLGASTSRTWVVSLNRGQWSPLASTNSSGSPTSSSIYPYGVMTSCTLTNPFNSNATVTCTIASGTGQTMTASTTQSWTPTSMSAVTMTNISASTAQGPTVYNNKGTQVSASPVAVKNDWDINNAVTYRPEAPVYVGSSSTTTSLNNASANTSQSNQAATQNMTLLTGTAYVPSHTYTDYVRFVRNPQTVRQWNSVSQSWQTSAISSSNYTITSGNQSVGSATVTYYTWQWTGTARGDTDLKFTF